MFHVDQVTKYLPRWPAWAYTGGPWSAPGPSNHRRFRAMAIHPTHPSPYRVTTDSLAVRVLVHDYLAANGVPCFETHPRPRWGVNMGLSSLCQADAHTACWSIRSNWRTVESTTCRCLCHQATNRDYWEAEAERRGFGSGELALRALAGDR